LGSWGNAPSLGGDGGRRNIKSRKAALRIHSQRTARGQQKNSHSPKNFLQRGHFKNNPFLPKNNLARWKFFCQK
jgi:hypothetical protein